MVRKVKKKKSGLPVFLTLLLMIVITVIVFKLIIIQGNKYVLEREYDNIISLNTSTQTTPASSDDGITPVPPARMELDPVESVSPDQLNSPNAILIRLSDDSVLLQKNSDEKIYPASLTKMMTTIVAIENLSDLNEEIELTNTTFSGLYEADASMAGFQPGEQVRTIDLLYGVMLPSGAECCIGLANRIAGSEQEFVKLMNQKAEELGMENTHFDNTTGLHDENHYTTVRDLSVLLSYALQNDTFREIFTSSRHTTQPTNKHPDGITLSSTMFKELSDQNAIGGEILGGKTGYTDKAGLCLASLGIVGDQEYVLVTAGAKGNHHSEQYNITDALTVYSNIGK